MILINETKKAYRQLKLVKKRYEIVNPKRNVPSVDRNMTANLRRQGFSLQDSFCYDLKYNDYRDYISTWEAWQPRKNSTPYFKISDDKYLFSYVFGPHIKVPPTYGLIEEGEIIGVDPTELSIRNLYEFLIRHGGGVIKDRYGYNGYNVYPFYVADGVLNYKGDPVMQEELTDIVKRFPRGIIQGKLKQGKFENDIFGDSINTIRIISMRKRDSIEHEVIGAVHRFGTKKSAPVDNFDQEGVCALIDIDTGYLGKLAGMYHTDENGRHIFFEKHPDTDMQIEGIRIPNWQELKLLVSKLTRVLPFFKFIAWDFVVQDDGFALIEINMKSSLYLFQIHGGMRHTFLGEKYREHGYLVEPWG